MSNEVQESLIHRMQHQALGVVAEVIFIQTKTEDGDTGLGFVCYRPAGLRAADGDDDFFAPEADALVGTAGNGAVSV